MHLKNTTMNILIADSGSTKTDWSVDRRTRSSSDDLQDAGHQSDSYAGCRSASDTEVGTHLAGITTGSIFLWQRCDRGDEAPDELLLQQAFPGAKVEAEGDMIGAARALFGIKPGIACILGTGANSCLMMARRL